jgi:hypothetical protein
MRRLRQSVLGIVVGVALAWSVTTFAQNWVVQNGGNRLTVNSSLPAVVIRQLGAGKLLSLLDASANEVWSVTVAGLQTVTEYALGTTSTDGYVLSNGTASNSTTTVQISPRMKWCGTAYNSTSAASETECFFIENLPATVAGTITGRMKIGFINNAGTVTYPVNFNSANTAGSPAIALGTSFNDGFYAVGTSGTVGFTAAASAKGGVDTANGLFGVVSLSLASAVTGSSDVWLTRVASGQVNLNGGTGQATGVGFDVTTDGTLKVRTRAQSADASLTALSLSPSSPAITVGSGTGITVNNTGEIRQVVYKVTVASTALVCAATTCDVTIATLPAKTFVTHAMADLVTTFACASVCTTATLSTTLGKTAGGAEYLASFDADAAAARFGLTTATLGASLTEATIPTTVGDMGSWTTTTTVTARFTSGTGNFGNGAASNLSQGSVTFYLTTEVMP